IEIKKHLAGKQDVVPIIAVERWLNPHLRSSLRNQFSNQCVQYLRVVVCMRVYLVKQPPCTLSRRTKLGVHWIVKRATDHSVAFRHRKSSRCIGQGQAKSEPLGEERVPLRRKRRCG